MSGRSGYYVAGIVFRRRRSEEGLITEVLVMDTLRGGKNKVALVQLPGGMQKDSDSSNPERTLRRELLEETSLVIVPDAEPFHLPTIVDKNHERHFYVVRETDTSGYLRTTPLEDGNTALGEPYWLDLRDFGKVCRTQRVILPFLEQALQEDLLPTALGPAV